MAQSLPKTAKQWNVTGFDGPESLVFSEQPVPQIGDSQVLVKSRFCAFSHPPALVLERVKLTLIHSSRGSHQRKFARRHSNSNFSVLIIIPVS